MLTPQSTQRAHNITLPGSISARCFRRQVPLCNLCPWAASWIWIPSPQSTCLPWRLGSSLHFRTRKPLMPLAILLLLLCACGPGSGPVMGPKAICTMHAEWARVPSTAQHYAHGLVQGSACTCWPTGPGRTVYLH